MKMPIKNKGKFKIRIEMWHILSAILIIFDMMAVNCSYFLALLIRFDGIFSAIPKEYLNAYINFIPINSAICLVIFILLKLYSTLWRYAGITDIMRAGIGSAVVSVIHMILITVLFRRMPLSYYLWGACFQYLVIIFVRLSYRIVSTLFSHRNPTQNFKKVMIIGAGSAGQTIARGIEKDRNTDDRVVCMIDDNSAKWGRYIDKIPIVGGRDDILSAVEQFEINKIYIAMPSASKEEIRDIITICSESDCIIKHLPDFYQYVNGEISVGAMKDVSVEDLLGREPVNTDLHEAFNLIYRKTILVTGGGGSIGSELCRQIAAHQPERLIIFDIYENNAYNIQQELKDKHPDLKLDVLIGSVRDSRRLEQIFSKYKPDIVYHAAAHKHVPLMEDSPCESIKNNVIGTYKTAYAAMIHNCEKFVLISTDKAVNPTNIMGASKRLCEMIIQSFDRNIKEHNESSLHRMFTHSETVGNAHTDTVPENIRTEFVAVRFGNVLGSNGSVVPLFKKQIENGGPVTVTHPDIIRYFMTIPEAVSLVLLAGTYAKGGEIFVLDMGSPVKIDTLARNLIKLSGLKPDVDIKIQYTGLRPGEKLFEEKLMEEEGLKTTPNKLIHIGNPIRFDTALFSKQLDELMLAAYENSDDIIDMVKEIVPTFKHNN